MKLGLIIEITSQGAGSSAKTYNFTPALGKYASASRSFIKEVFPAREDLRLKGLDPYTSLDESSRSVVFLRFLGPEGYLICVFQARPENSGRPYDGAAAWIHVPSSVMLTGSETERLIDEVDAALSEERGINYQRLDVLFTKEYEKRNVLSLLSTIGSNGSTSGIRYYGVGTDYQLSELLGSNIAQKVYGNYKAVFLLRKNAGIAVFANEITTPLIQTCFLSTPSPVNGFNAFYENGRPFNIDLEYPINTPLTIVWKKNGYQDVQKTAIVGVGYLNETSKLFTINKEDIKVAIKKQIFNVIGGGKYLHEYNIFIDGVHLKDVLYIREDKLAQGVRIKVTADGYKTYTNDHILTVDTQQVDIELKKQTFIYEFSIPMYADGERIDDGIISIELNKRLKECPIEGYSFMSEHIHEGEGEINHLERSGMEESIKHFAYGFLTCVGIILAVYLYNIIDEIDHVKFKLGWPPIEFIMHSTKGSSTGYTDPKNTGENYVDDNDCATLVDSVDNYSFEKAIAYLNSKNTWCKDSIAKYPSLEGLFDALNEYKFKEIVNEWAPKLQDVTYFSNVVQAAIEAIEGNWEPRQGNPFYNKQNDNKINLDNYSRWISVDQTYQQENVTQQHSASHIKPETKPTESVAKPGASTDGNNNKKNNKRGKV